MDLRTYLRAIRKNSLVILLAVVLGAVAAIGYTSQVTKVYRSGVTFFVSTPVDTNSGGSSFQADQYAQRRVESYVKLANSDELAKRIKADSGLSLPLGAIESKISATADLNTVLMTVFVDDTSPSRGLQIARAVATQFPAYVGTLQTSDNTVKLLVTSGPSSRSAPIAPRSKLYLLAGLAAGLLIGLLIALLRELFDTTLRSVEALKTLTDLPILGSIPLDRRARTAPIVSQVDGHSLRAEAYRQVRSGVQFADASARVQVLVVASSVAAEGKSSTSANIALTFAEYGRRTLLIEADLRRPRVADYMSLDGAAGLTNVLIGQVDLADVLQPWGDSGLTLLASGSLPPNPSELLGSERMSRLLTGLRTMFEVIVIDTPPLVPVTDGAVVATLADGVVLVVRAGKTSRNQVLTALDVLESADTRMLGCVLSMVPRRRTLRRAYDSYAYYDKIHNERGALTRPADTDERVLGYLPTGNPVSTGAADAAEPEDAPNARGAVTEVPEKPTAGVPEGEPAGSIEDDAANPAEDPAEDSTDDAEDPAEDPAENPAEDTPTAPADSRPPNGSAAPAARVNKATTASDGPAGILDTATDPHVDRAAIGKRSAGTRSGQGRDRAGANGTDTSASHDTGTDGTDGTDDAEAVTGVVRPGTNARPRPASNVKRQRQRQRRRR